MCQPKGISFGICKLKTAPASSQIILLSSIVHLTDATVYRTSSPHSLVPTPLSGSPRLAPGLLTVLLLTSCCCYLALQIDLLTSLGVDVAHRLGYDDFNESLCVKEIVHGGCRAGTGPTLQ